MTDNNINHLAKLLEEKDNMPFCTYKEEARWLLENGVIVLQQGKWKIKRDDCDFEYMMCSCCKEEFFPEGCVVEITPNFCPNCGAKMDFHWLDHEDCPYECPFVKKNQDKEGGRQ